MHRSTKSNTQKKIEETQIDSLAASSTPVKPKLRPKKQSQPSKSATSPSKQAPVNLPGSKSGITASIVVTATKRKESRVESNEDKENSIQSEESKKEEKESPTRSKESKKDKESQHKGSDGEESPATKAKMSTPFDTKLEHLLINYLSATRVNHDIRQAFIYEGILTFENFTDGCDLVNIEKYQQKDGTNVVQAFTSAKLKIISNVLLYYLFLMDNSQEVLTEGPVSWVKSDFRKWKTKPSGTATQNASNAGTQQTSNVTPPSTTRLEDDTLLNWRKSRQDVTSYPIIDNNVQYPDWIIKIKRQFISDECEKIIDLNKHFVAVKSGSDTLLWNAQENHLASVLDRVLKTNEGMRLVRTHPDDPRKIWKKHEDHSTSSTTSSCICTMLSQNLATVKISEFDNPLQGLDKFDSDLQKFNKVSHNNSMTDDLAIMYLRSTTHGSKDLLSAWAQCKTVHDAMGKPAPTYDEFHAYLLKFLKKVEAAITDDTTSQKDNSANSSYLSPYSPSDDQYEDATELNPYMGERGDVDAIHEFLLCSKVLKEGKPRPPSRSRRRDSPREELKIQQPLWSTLNKRTKDAWIRDSDESKDSIIKQLPGNSKAIVQATKNHNLRSSYNTEIGDSDEYESDFTHNSEGMWQFMANSTMYDTTNNEDGESVSEGTKMNVNAAAASATSKESVLNKRRGKKVYKSSEMPTAAVAKMMASKQLEVRDPTITQELVSYLTYASKMAVIDYTRFNSMITENVTDKDVHYNSNLSHAHEVEFLENLSKRIFRRKIESSVEIILP